MSVLQKLLSSQKAQRHYDREAELYRNLIRREAKLGGKIFGEVPAGTKREFFCLDEHTWIWHEEWTDKKGSHHIKTTRYDVRPDGILKAQDGQAYQHVTVEEATRLLQAARMYEEKLRTELYAPYLQA